MRAFVGVVLGALVLGSTLGGSETISQAVNLEKRGEAAEARTLLQRAARNPAALIANTRNFQPGLPSAWL